MANTYNITMKQYNGTDYDILYPTTGGGQVTPSSSVLDKFNIINSINTTGNYTNLDDVLGYLGTLNMYWWKRRQVGQYEAVVSSSYSTATIIPGSSSYYIYVADSVTASSSGVTLNSPTSSFVNWTSSDNDIIQTIRNKYWYSSAYSDNIYYSCNGSIQTSGYQKTTQSYSVTSQLAFGDWEYVQSTSSSTYPQSGEQDGYEYVFLGAPFQNIINGAQIETGSYVGTGTYGPSNPTKITFSGKPYLVFLYDLSSLTGNITVALYGEATVRTEISNDLSNPGNYAFLTWENNSISWYDPNYTNSPIYNESGVTYGFIAFLC